MASLPHSASSEPLDRPALRDFVRELALREGDWLPAVRHDREQRVFVPLLDEPLLEAWLICWMPGHDTGFHDHDVSQGAVIVVDGEIREQRLGIGEVIDRRFGVGQVFDFSAADIHRVMHEGLGPAVTLHAYAPRLRRMGAYARSPDGWLQRHPLAYGEELRPLPAGRS